MINELTKVVHKNAKDKGFHAGPADIPRMLCLIHSEVSEALEADRIENRADLTKLHHGDPIEEWNQKFREHVKDTFEDELADIVIRVMDLAGLEGIDLEAHILAKIQYNSTREDQHGKRY